MRCFFGLGFFLLASCFGLWFGLGFIVAVVFCLEFFVFWFSLFVGLFCLFVCFFLKTHYLHFIRLAPPDHLEIIALN